MLSVKEMDNIFITDCFEEWTQTKPPKKVQFANKVLRKLKFSVFLSPPISTGTMTSVEQRMNMFHLASAVLVYDVSGEFVELAAMLANQQCYFRRL